MRGSSLRALAAVAAVALALGLAACGDDDDDGGGGAAGGAAAESDGGEGAQAASLSLKIGDLVPLTGALSTFGPPGRKASDLAVAQIKEAVAAAGADIDVSVAHADTETADQAAVQAARRIISGGASCITGPWASSETIAAGTSVAARQRVPIITPSGTSAPITDLQDNGYVFRTAPSDNLQAQALADTIEEELGGTEGAISLAARNDAYGEGFINRFKEAWEAAGGTTLGPVLYDPAQPSFNSEAAEIVANDPAAYVIIDYPETYAKMGAALARAGGFDASRLFTADGLAATEIPADIPRQSLVGARGTRPAAPEAGRLAERFDELWESAPGPDRYTFDASTFDATMLCFLAAVAAGSSDGSDIQAELQAVSGPGGTKYDYTQLAEAIRALQRGDDIDYEGVTGPVDFDENGDPSTATYEVWSYDRDGTLVVDRQFRAGEVGG